MDSSVIIRGEIEGSIDIVVRTVIMLKRLGDCPGHPYLLRGAKVHRSNSSLGYYDNHLTGY